MAPIVAVASELSGAIFPQRSRVLGSGTFPPCPQPMRAVLALLIAAPLAACDFVKAAAGVVPDCHDAAVLDSLIGTVAEAAARNNSEAAVGELTREPYLTLSSPIEVTRAGAPGRQCELQATSDPQHLVPHPAQRFRITYSIHNATDGSGAVATFESKGMDNLIVRIRYLAMVYAARAH